MSNPQQLKSPKLLIKATFERGDRLTTYTGNNQYIYQPDKEKNVMTTQINTHKSLIRRRLTEGGSITPLEALRDFGCYRLASRISDLRREGMKITKRMEESVSRVTGKPVRYSRYYIEQGNGESRQTPNNQ